MIVSQGAVSVLPLKPLFEQTIWHFPSLPKGKLGSKSVAAHPACVPKQICPQFVFGSRVSSRKDTVVLGLTHQVIDETRAMKQVALAEFD